MVLGYFRPGYGQSFEDLYERSVQYYNENNYIESKRVLIKALNYKRKELEVRYLLGMCHGFLGEYDEAEKQFLRCLEINPRYEPGFVQLGSLYFNKKEYAQAVRFIKKGLAINPRDGHAHDILGTIYNLHGLNGKALDEWNKIGKPLLNKIFVNEQAYDEASNQDLCFFPGRIIKPAMVRESERRFDLVGNRSMVAFHIAPTEIGGDDYDLYVSYSREKGFARSVPLFFINLLKDVGQSTFHLKYKDIADSRINLYASSTFNKFRRDFSVRLTTPRLFDGPFYYSLDFRHQDEDWSLRKDGIDQGNDIRMRSEKAALKITWLWQDRILIDQNIQYKRKMMAGADRITADVISYGGGVQYDLFRSANDRVLSSVKVSYDIFWQSGERAWQYGKYSLAWKSSINIKKELSEEITDKILFQIKSGWTSKETPWEERYILGIGQNTDDYLRAHDTSYEGKYGNSPITGRFLLTNIEYRHRLFELFKMGIEAGIFFDYAVLLDDEPYNFSDNKMHDIGVLLNIQILDVPLTISYGYNLDHRKRALYVGANYCF